MPKLNKFHVKQEANQLNEPSREDKPNPTKQNTHKIQNINSVSRKISKSISKRAAAFPVLCLSFGMSIV